jgi:hypothetical protein
VPLQIKNLGLPAGENDVLYWAIEEGDLNVLETFGKGIREKIKSSPEYQQRVSGEPAMTDAGNSQPGAFKDLDDDIPF